MMHNGLRIEYKKGDYKRALLGIILIIAALLGTTAAYLAMAATFGRNPALFAVEVYQHYFRYSRCAESYPEIGSPAGWVWDLGYRDGVEDCALVNVMSGSVHSLPILSVSRLSHTELESMRKIIEGKVPIRKDCVLIKCLDVKDVEYFLTTCTSENSDLSFSSVASLKAKMRFTGAGIWAEKACPSIKYSILGILQDNQ